MIDCVLPVFLSYSGVFRRPHRARLGHLTLIIGRPDSLAELLLAEASI